MVAVVITPTVGNDHLLQAVHSVSKQTHREVNHLIVVDGKQFFDKIPSKKIQSINPRAKIVYLEKNVGANGFYGHRIYASFPHLVDEEYVLFLDEDNWFENNHVESLIREIETNNYDWAYSLRNIVDGDESIQDNCESLGRWPVWTSYVNNNPTSYHIDTSAYCFRREFIILAAHLWHFGYGADRRFYHLIKTQEKYGTSRKYTLNYRASSTETSLSKNFIEVGNDVMRKIYEEKYPWNLEKQ